MSKDTNSGHYNSGDYNSGHYNSGYWNSGNGNSGNGNSGHYNSGYRNSGHYNSGDYNSGDYNSGDYNSGIFNTDEPFMRMFNKDTKIKRSEFSFPSMEYFDVSYWIPEDQMTKEEKKENPTYKTTGGYIKEVEYKEAWAIFWRRTTEENREKFLDLPNFDAEIFEEITGINMNVDMNVDMVTLPNGKKVSMSTVEEALKNHISPK